MPSPCSWTSPKEVSSPARWIASGGAGGAGAAAAGVAGWSALAEDASNSVTPSHSDSDFDVASAFETGLDPRPVALASTMPVASTRAPPAIAAVAGTRSNHRRRAVAAAAPVSPRSSVSASVRSSPGASASAARRPRDGQGRRHAGARVGHRARGAEGDDRLRIGVDRDRPVEPLREELGDARNARRAAREQDRVELRAVHAGRLESGREHVDRALDTVFDHLLELGRA